jgi:cytochrome b
MTSDVEHPPVRVWDLPTRAFHWLLALAVIGLVITAKVGGNAMLWHMRLGLAVLALLSFRIIWGLVGGRWSRFASFIYAPTTVLRYLRGDHRPGDHFEVGHSPIGAFSVFALITVLLVQVGTGLIADDEIATIGPLNRYVANATGLLATSWHKGYGQWILLGLVALHIAAIVVYKLRGKSLVKPMITGDKPLPPDVPATQDGPASRGLAAVVLAACVALVLWIARQGS